MALLSKAAGTAAAAANPWTAGLDAVGGIAKAMTDSGDTSSQNRIKAGTGQNKKEVDQTFGGVEFPKKHHNALKILIIFAACYGAYHLATKKKLLK